MSLFALHIVLLIIELIDNRQTASHHNAAVTSAGHKQNHHGAVRSPGGVRSVCQCRF